MSAETRRWQEMGRGEYGQMRESFLLLVGKVPGAAETCPK